MQTLHAGDIPADCEEELDVDEEPAVFSPRSVQTYRHLKQLWGNEMDTAIRNSIVGHLARDQFVHTQVVAHGVFDVSQSLVNFIAAERNGWYEETLLIYQDVVSRDVCETEP